MIDATLFHFSCGHSMNKKAEDDICPLCGSGLLTGEQPIQIMPADVRECFQLTGNERKGRMYGLDRVWGKSVLDEPEYKEAQAQLNKTYRGMIDAMPGKGS